MTHNDSQVEARDEILHALIALGHQITADEVRFFRDTSKDTTALAQLCDSLEAAWNRRTALSALAAGKVEAIPEGWKLVPMEPTADMAAEGQHWVAEGFDWPKAVYRAMVKVAPSPLSADPESAVVGAAKEGQ